MRRAALLVAVAALALPACGGDDKEGAAADTTGTPTETVPTAEVNPPGSCSQVAPPEPQQTSGGQQKPKEKLAAGQRHLVTVVTNCGDFTIQLDTKNSPNATASFVALAKANFFDGTVFHRIVPGFVIQGGDPTGSGSGGPGYSTVDKPPATATYTRGVVAMAKTGAEPPGTGGSQFFVVTGADVGLPPEYALLGKVTEGAAVVNRIGRFGDPATEEPTQVVAILDMKVSTAPEGK